MEYDITLSSKNEVLNAFIAAPADCELEVVCTSFTAQTSIVILERTDYISINGIRYYFDDEYIEMYEETFLMLLANMLSPVSVNVAITNTHLIQFSSDDEFEIDDMSYNVKLLTGMFWDCRRYGKVITGECVPYYLSTPVLYLISNIGATNYNNLSNTSAAITGAQTLMKINNSGNRQVPIMAGNCDFTVKTTANALSQANFRLVDQNLHNIRLLDPFTITLKIRASPKNNPN